MKVNILLAAYNGERFIKEQIASIQAQDFSDWTLLVRDDGSSDHTRQIVQALSQDDSRIRLIDAERHDNLGVIASFYRLLKYEEADYYFFSDQDDVWLPHKLSHSLNAAKNHDKSQPLMVYTDLKVVDQELTVVHDSMIRTQSHHANTTLVQELTENTVTGGTMMINHALAMMWQRPDNLLMHDWYLALLATSFGQLVYLDEATELYRQHDHNVLGARTWSKRIRNWGRPHRLVAKYWWLIKASQKQAKMLLDQPLRQEDRQLVTAFVTLMDQTFLQRYRILKQYQLRKNRWFHTFIFRSLILTKFGYRRSE